MIIGDCPYCEHTNMTPIGPIGAWSKEICGDCKKEYWLQHSRFDPMAYSLGCIKVDKKTKLVEIIEENTEKASDN